MQEVIWSEQVMLTGRSSISISGANNVFCSALVVLFRNIISPAIITMPEIQVQVFVGMTLPQVFVWRMKEDAAMEGKIPRIVFCTDSCFRMLSGTSGYERTLFITPDTSIYAVAEIIRRWIAGYASHASDNVLPLLTRCDNRTMQMLEKDIPLPLEA